MSYTNTSNDLSRVKIMYNNFRDIFEKCQYHNVISEYSKIHKMFVDMSFDEFHTDISPDDRCIFIYGIKDKSKLFFNMLFENDNIEDLVNISTPNNKFSYCGTIDDCIKNTKKLF